MLYAKVYINILRYSIKFVVPFWGLFMVKKSKKTTILNKIDFGINKIFKSGHGAASYVVAIPSGIRDTFNIEPGDKFDWVVDFDNGIVEIRVLSKNNEAVYDKPTNTYIIKNQKQPLQDEFIKANLETKRALIEHVQKLVAKRQKLVEK